MLVLIKGAGDLATGNGPAAVPGGLFSDRLTDLEQPTAVRRSVAFCQCIYDGGLRRWRDHRPPCGRGGGGRTRSDGGGEIPVLADPAAEILHALPFDALRWTPSWPKRNTGTPLPTLRWCWPWGQVLRPGRTATAWWRPCGATIWGGCSPRGGATPQHRRPPGRSAAIRGAHHPRPGAGDFEPLARIGQPVTKGDARGPGGRRGGLRGADRHRPGACSPAGLAGGGGHEGRRH